MNGFYRILSLLGINCNICSGNRNMICILGYGDKRIYYRNFTICPYLLIKDMYTQILDDDCYEINKKLFFIGVIL